MRLGIYIILWVSRCYRTANELHTISVLFSISCKLKVSAYDCKQVVMVVFICFVLVVIDILIHKIYIYFRFFIENEICGLFNSEAI